jgi:hypothetical protein
MTEEPSYVSRINAYVTGFVDYKRGNGHCPWGEATLEAVWWRRGYNASPADPHESERFALVMGSLEAVIEILEQARRRAATCAARI